jgi:predicted PP-loop superfamily ATPase
MPMCGRTERRVLGAVARDLDVHVLAWNAGAGLSLGGVPIYPDDDWVASGRSWSLPAGWAAWYAAGDELR